MITSHSGSVRPLSAITAWLRDHDTGYVALRRAVRTALIMPALFALGDKVIGNPTLATFAAFGSFAMLLLVDFPGPITDRLRYQAALGVSCALLISLGTLASRTAWIAAMSMAIVAFGVLFAGAVSSVLAGATTPLLLAFILPVSLQGSAASIPDRVAGWGLAAAASLLAISLLWPAEERNPLREFAVTACRALADRVRADVRYLTSARGADAERAHRAALTRAEESVRAMEQQFFATPYRPSGLSTDTRALVRLVDELRWLNTIVLRSAPVRHSPRAAEHVLAVKAGAAEVLERAAELMEAPRGPTDRLHAALDRMHVARKDLVQATVALLAPKARERGGAERSGGTIVSSLDPGFRAQELDFVAAQVATNAEIAAAAARRSWLARLLGRQPGRIPGPLAAAQRRVGARASRESLWLHNSVRGAVALGLAVLVADVSTVQHSFWVAFGTLAVLRSNALSTGQSILRALAGTAIGFLVGGVLVYLIGTDTTVLWVLLPLVILLAGLAPSAVSFAAGQAAFTLTLLILFNIIAPAGWKIGLIRVEDVALGGAVSLAVGLLFWPRGAAAGLARDLAQAYRDSARYLADAVAHGASCCDAVGPRSAPPRDSAVAAVAAARRLDDTFRGYLGERGSKQAPLAAITSLTTGVVGMRLAADAVLDLWDGDGAQSGDRSGARRELTGAAGAIVSWYDQFALALTGSESVPDPMGPDPAAEGRLVNAVGRDLRDSDGRATATGVRVIWTGDHLDAVRRLEEILVAPARAAVSQSPRSPLDRIAHSVRASRRPPR